MLTKKKLVDTYRIRSSMVNSEIRYYRRQKISVSYDEEGEIKDDFRVPKKTKMKPRYYCDVKDFGENLNPLWRFLEKSVNKNWDKVYSKLVTRFDKRSVIGNHIYRHLWDFVERDVKIIDGVPCAIGSSCNIDGYSPIFGSNSGLGIQFYIDPRDGRLKKAPPYP